MRPSNGSLLKLPVGVSPTVTSRAGNIQQGTMSKARRVIQTFELMGIQSPAFPITCSKKSTINNLEELDLQVSPTLRHPLHPSLELLWTRVPNHYSKPVSLAAIIQDLRYCNWIISQTVSHGLKNICKTVVSLVRGATSASNWYTGSICWSKHLFRNYVMQRCTGMKC